MNINTTEWQQSQNTNVHECTCIRVIINQLLKHEDFN